MPALIPLAALAGTHRSAGLVIAGLAVIAVATLAGAWLARRRPNRDQAWLGAAAGALLVIALVHLLPDAWTAARASGVWALAVPAAVAGSFGLAGLAARQGCWCGISRQRAAGAGTVGALSVHRFLEGSALALAASATVAAALAVHALAEGLAAGALLGRSSRRQAAWLAAMCLSPIAGAATASAWPLPAAAQPITLAVAAGVLAQAARISLAGAWRAGGRRFDPATAASFLAAVAITALAVHAS